MEKLLLLKGLRALIKGQDQTVLDTVTTWNKKNVMDEFLVLYLTN